MEKVFWKSKEILLGAVIIAVAVLNQFGINVDIVLLIGALGLNQVFARIRQN